MDHLSRPGTLVQFIHVLRDHRHHIPVYKFHDGAMRGIRFRLRRAGPAFVVNSKNPFRPRVQVSGVATSGIG
jgi:hypothetical protein